MKKELSKHSKELLLLFDLQGLIEEASSSVLPVLGYQEEDILNISFYNLIHPEDKEKYNLNEIISLLSEKSELVLQQRIRNKSGVYVWFDTYFKIIKNAKNIPINLVGILHPLEYKSKEEFYIDFKKNCDFLIKHSQDIVSLHDLSGNIVYISPGIENILGYAPSELTGTGLENIHEDDIEIVKNKSLLLSMKGLPSSVEYRNRTKEGSYVWMETFSSVIKDDEGNPFQILCTSKNITQRKNIENKLKESQQKYQSLFKHNPDIVLRVGLDGVISDINEAAIKLWNISKEQIIGKHYNEISNPDNSKLYLDIFEEAKSGKKNTITVESKNHSGEKITVQITNFPIIVEGKISGISTIIRDISEVTRLVKEKELIFKVSTFIDNSDTLKIALDSALQEICNYTESIIGELWMKSSTGEFVKLQHSYCINDPKLLKFVEKSKGMKLKRGEGVVGKSWEHHKTLWFENVLTEPFFLRKTDAEKLGLKSCFLAPLVSNGECIAVINLFFNFTKREDKQVLDFLKTTTNHLATEIIKRKSTEQLNLFFNISTDLLGIAGFDGYFKKINKSFEEALGHNIEDILKTPFHQFIHPDDIEITDSEIKGLEDGQPVLYFENRMVCKDGSIKWFEWTAQSLPNQEVFFCIGRDITFQKSREEELLRIKLAVEGTNDAVVILDQDQKPVYHNKAYLQILGYSIEDIILYGGPGSIYADPRQLDDIKKTLESGKSFEGDAQLISKSKEIIDFNIRANTINNNKNQLIGFLLIFTDIRERIKMEKKIQYEKYFAESTINALPGIFYMIDVDGKMIRWNENLEKVTGYSTKEIEAMNPVEFFNYEEKERIIFTIQEVFEKGEADLEALLKIKSGEKIPYYFTGILSQVNADKFLLGFGIDITNQKTVEEQLKLTHKILAEKAEALIASNEELENFAYIASHDLQEPLRMITGFLQLIKEKYDSILDEEGHQYFTYILESADRMKALILDLLEYSRVGTSMAEIIDIDANDVVENVITIFKDKITENNVTLIYEKLPVIKGVKIQVIQLFQNLIGNAIKYRSSKDPLIKIHVEEQENQWLFSISDNGIGISEKFYERIFIIFQRLHNRKEYSGTGIGLAICKKIIDRHGGSIWVESVPKEGSTFYFTFLK